MAEITKQELVSGFEERARASAIEYGSGSVLSQFCLLAVEAANGFSRTEPTSVVVKKQPGEEERGALKRLRDTAEEGLAAVAITSGRSMDLGPKKLSQTDLTAARIGGEVFGIFFARLTDN